MVGAESIYSCVFSAVPIDATYFPQVEEAIWSEFSGPVYDVKACFRDGEQSEYLVPQRRELEVERLRDFAVLDEFRAPIARVARRSESMYVSVTISVAIIFDTLWKVNHCAGPQSGVTCL